jgi:hypothetical protein
MTTTGVPETIGVGLSVGSVAGTEKDVAGELSIGGGTGFSLRRLLSFRGMD